jgi:molybdopterin synthase catalytic subunit
MSLPLLHITPDLLDPGQVCALVTGSEAPGSHGAIVSFIGAVRRENQGRQVERLEYEAYEPLAVKALSAIVSESEGYWPGVRLAVWHRTGVLAPGDISIVIVAASPHRHEAFRASRYTIERVKQIVPIWKREIFDDGEAWLEGATADPGDVAARQAAYARACG